MDSEAVLRLLQRVAEEVVNPRFRALERGEVHTKRRPGDLVTVADREAEILIAAALRRHYPGALIVGEEAASVDSSIASALDAAGRAFTIDPVDGTRNFVKGSPDHALMVAELRIGEVVRSWIWQPQHGVAFVAERGGGAWRDGVRMSVDDHSGHGRTGTCCGIDYPRLASGAARFGAYLKTKPWDHAPGSLLLTEAGGFVGSLRGVPYRPGAPPRLLVARR